MKLKFLFAVALLIMGCNCSAKTNAVEAVVADAYRRYVAGEMSKGAFADFCVTAAKGEGISAETRASILSGAFRCYMEIGAVNYARDVVVTMVNNKVPRQEIVDLMRESNIYFGVTCFDYGCTRILDSVYRSGAFFRPTDVAVPTLDDLSFGRLDLGPDAQSPQMETACVSMPAPDCFDVLVCTTKCVRVNVTSLRTQIDGVKLFLDPSTRDVFLMEFLMSRPSHVSGDDFDREVEHFCNLLTKRFGSDISVIRYPPDEKDDRFGAHSFTSCTSLFGDAVRHDSFEVERANIADYGIGDMQIFGSVYEDMHHFKFVRIRIGERKRLEKAFRGCGKLLGNSSFTFQNFPNIGLVNPVEAFLRGNEMRLEAISRDLGARGRTCEPTMPDAAAWYYERAAEYGNSMARKWLTDHSSVVPAIVGRKSIYGLTISKLAAGVCHDGTGWSPDLEWVSSDSDRLCAHDNLYGAKVGIFGNTNRGTLSGVVAAGLVNLYPYMSVVNGMAVAGLGNFGYGMVCNGVQVGGLLNANLDSTCNGISVAGWTDATWYVNGIQCAYSNVGAGVNGLSVAAYVNLSGSVNGLQVCALWNAVIADFHFPDEVWEKMLHMHKRAGFHFGDGNVRGVQLAGLMNYVDGEMRGVQIGVVNYAKRLRGMQIGLANMHQEGMVIMMPFLRISL